MSFRNRLVVFLMATLVCVQAATAIFAYTYLRGQIIERGKRELSDAMQSFTRQIDFLSQRATDGVEVLSLDYAFRAAIAKSDHDTELSVLRNHGRRIGAARMMLIRLDGTISADTVQARHSGGKFPFATLLGTAAAGDRGTALVTLANHVYWMVVVPVRAPLPIAFIAASIPLDSALLDEIRRISSSPHPIALAAKSENGAWGIVAHTGGAGDFDLPAIRDEARAPAIVLHRNSRALAIVAPLKTAEGSAPVAAVIDFPLSEALAAYRGLVTPMLLMLGAALIVAAGGATLIVRRVSRPLESLAAAAQRIAAGDYSHALLPRRGRDEIGRLTASIADMTGAIADREAALTGAMEAAEIARVEAVKANEVKSQFLANMSHELRTPLNAIVGFSQMLEEQVLGAIGNPRYVQYAHDIKASGEHLRDLFERMLDLAQAESHSLSLAREPLLVGMVVREAVEMHRAFARRADVQLVLAPGAEGIRTDGDASKLRQSLSNIIHNAIKFTPPGGSVTISTRVQRERAVIRITDTGTGIKPEHLQSVLKPFHRLRSALDGQHQGAGLGLAYARAIAEMHGGEVSVVSALGQGTAVVIELPIAQQAVEYAA
ncbi:MAG TPA: ATP-binding protein [Rhizomicrobium sp.]|jgi:signal transduction histidine kinase|nr:ATP-binding protein [Rhizomicrobium sp.]